MEDKIDLVYNTGTGEFAIVPSASFEDTEKCIVDDACSVEVVTTIDKMEEHIKVDEKPYSEDVD